MSAPLLVIMPRLLLTVERRWTIRGKGLSLGPPVVPVADQPIKVGDRVILVRPDGSTMATMIRGTATRADSDSTTRVELLLDLTDKDEVPIGTEVWSVGL